MPGDVVAPGTPGVLARVTESLPEVDLQGDILSAAPSDWAIFGGMLNFGHVPTFHGDGLLEPRVEANMFGFKDYKDIGEMVLPYELSDGFMIDLQDELDAYHDDPGIAKNIFERRKKKWAQDYIDYYPNYAKGFVKWLDLNNNSPTSLL